MAPLEEGDVVCVAARRQLVRGGQRRPALHLLLLTIVCLRACLLADIVQNIGCGTVADTVCYGRSCVRSRLQGMVDLMTMHVAGLWGCCTLAEAAVVWCALPSSCINGCISQCVGVIMVCAMMFVQCSCNAATLLCVGS